MFLEYQNEIIGLIAILVLSVIYLIIKIRSPKIDTEADIEEEPQEEVTETIDPYDLSTEQEYEENSEEEITQELEGSEEGDFGVDETPLTNNRRKLDIQKRDIPKHGKITKENFKEFAGTRILVAEDNLINQKVISGLLVDSGIELTMADDGQEVLDILEKDDDFLMVLMDAHMPRVDGFEATKAIRATPKYDHILVVALSGDTAADDIKKMRDAGMAEQLEKPLRMDSLYDVLYAYSGQKEAPENDADYIEVPMTRELHGDKGLAICGGDEKFYFEILNEFIDMYADSATRLRELLKNSELKKADKLLLDIIGVSANIGAEQFTYMANHLKEALQDTEEKSYYSYLEQYHTHLDKLVKDIKDFMNR